MQKIPDYLGLGTPEDSLASCYNLVPKAPKKDIVTYLINANKVLRYGCRMDTEVDVDINRKFVLIYNLSEGTIQIMEMSIPNSGRSGGKFLSSRKLPKPDSNQNKPDYYTAKDLYIGALVKVYSHRFIITSADLYVFKYMKSHPEQFSVEMIENLKQYHINEGNLKPEFFEKSVRFEDALSANELISDNDRNRIPDPQITESEVKELYHNDASAEIPCNIDTGSEPIIPSDQGVVKFKEDYEK